MPGKDKNPQPRKIGFRTSHDEEVEPMQQIDTTEETEEEQTQVMLEDYIPGAVYDGAGNIVTYESFRAKIRKIKAEAKSLNRVATAKFILYVSLAASILMLSYGAYKKYLNPTEKVKTEMNQKQR